MGNTSRPITRPNRDFRQERLLSQQQRQCIASDVLFYTIEDLQALLGWSSHTVKKLFNDPNFPAADFGRKKVVEAHALIDYFSKRHESSQEKYWNQ